MATKYKEIMHGIQKQLKERVAKYDDLVNKHVMLKKEVVTIKKKGVLRIIDDAYLVITWSCNPQG
jgi:hypothetical protein